MNDAVHLALSNGQEQASHVRGKRVQSGGQTLANDLGNLVLVGNGLDVNLGEAISESW